MILPTSPHHKLDDWLWPILSSVWEPFSRKNAHWWHYYNSVAPDWLRLRLEIGPDLNAGNRYRNLWTMFYNTNFGDANVVVIDPVFGSGLYQIGYQAQVGSRLITQRCSLILRGSFGFLATNHSVSVWGEAFPSRKPVRLVVSYYTTRKRLPADIPLL